MKKLSAIAAANAASRKTRISISGLAWRSSYRQKTTSRITPATSGRTVCAEPQPYVPGWLSPYTIATTAGMPRARPPASRRWPPVRPAEPRRRAAVISAPTTPIGTFT